MTDGTGWLVSTMVSTPVLSADAEGGHFEHNLGL